LPRVRRRASIREMGNVSGHPEHGPSSFQTLRRHCFRCGRPAPRAGQPRTALRGL